jgi:hypothetical protein
MRFVSHGKPDPALMGPRQMKPLPLNCEWFRLCPCRNSANVELRGDVYDEGHDYQYRVTPEGEATVPDLIPPGTAARTSYGGTPYVVVAVRGPFFFHPPERAEAFEFWSLDVVDPAEWEAGKSTATSWLSEYVAVGGRLRALFTNNDNEILIEGKAASRPARQVRPAQLELFA